MKVLTKEICTAAKTSKRGTKFWHRIASAALCIVILGSNATTALAAGETETENVIPAAETTAPTETPAPTEAPTQPTTAPAEAPTQPTTAPAEAPALPKQTEVHGTAGVQIAAWVWANEETAPVERDGEWIFNLTGAENLSEEQLKERLPKEVRATLSDGGESTLPLNWDLTPLASLFDAAQGTNAESSYRLSAAIEGEYALAEGVKGPSILCTLDDAEENGAEKDGAEKDGAEKDGAEKDGAEKDGAEKDGAEKDGAEKDGAGETDTAETKLCKHHTAHDEACGYTEENPVCSFVCVICPVQQQIDELLAQIEQLAQTDAEELDEEATMQLYEKLLAASEAYNLLEPAQQEQITGMDTLEAVMETLNVRNLDDATMTIIATVRGDGTEQTLADGAGFSVDFSKQFTLHILVESTLNLEQKRVEITIPDGLTVVEYPIPERGDMADGVVPGSLAELNSSNSYGGYCPKTGTITYSLKSTATENSFNIILAPDTVLWNRQATTTLAEPLTIRTYTEGESGREYERISGYATITGEYYNDQNEPQGRAQNTGPRLSPVGVKTGVPTAAGDPFALRQLWLNPDKDRIDDAWFLKKLEINIALPYYINDAGETVYAEFDHISYDRAGASDLENALEPKDDSGTQPSIVPDDTNHIVTVTWTDLYLEGGEYFTPYFKWKEECSNTEDNAIQWNNSLIPFNNGYVGAKPDVSAATPAAAGGTVTWQDGTEWYLWNGKFGNLTFKAYGDENMEVKGAGRNVLFNTGKNNIDYLGQFHVVNQGGKKSAEKTVEFEYTHTDLIGVTAQRIPASSGNTVKVWYTTNLNSTETEAGSFTSQGGFVTFTSTTAGLGPGEYFTKIKAEVGEYEKDYVGYVASRSSDPTSGYATTFGKLLTNGAINSTEFAFMKMYNTGEKPETGRSASYKLKTTTALGQIPLGMERAYKEDGSLERVPILSETTAKAGDEITVNGLISSSAYPYSNINNITDPEIYIRLPAKIAIKEGSVRLYSRAGSNADKIFLLDAVTESGSPTTTEISTGYTFETLHEEDDTEDSYNLYRIKFDDEKIGWFTQDLGQYQLGLSFVMKIDTTADAMTLDMRDCIRVKSASVPALNDPTATLNQYQVKDSFDVDGDNDKNELISTFNINEKGTKLSVVAVRKGLTFTFGAKMTEDETAAADFNPENYSNYEVDKQKVYLKDDMHVIDMLFTLKNDTGRAFTAAEAQAFYYFIPVPKEGAFWDSHMQSEPFDFDMKLLGEPKLNGVSAEHIQVTYSTEIVPGAPAGSRTHYASTDTYVTADKISDSDWGAVKMIRIAAKPDVTSIPKNAELQISARLRPAFQSNAELVGSVVNFGLCGVSPYSVGATTNQGHNPLPRIQVEFQTGVISGKIFLDKNFNGIFDEGIDELYKGTVDVKAPHKNGTGNGDEESHETTATDGTFTFTSFRADDYILTVFNPGSPDANSATPLKFSLPKDGAFAEAPDKNAAQAAVTVNGANYKTNQTLEIGLQQPHTVTFQTDTNKATLSKTSTNVWNGSALGDSIPTVTAKSGWRFDDMWSVGTDTMSTEELKAALIEGSLTATPQLKQLYTVTYDGNGNTAGSVPPDEKRAEGDSFRLNYTDTQELRRNGELFVGWSASKITNALTATAKDDPANDLTKEIIPADEENTMEAKNITFYAVWATNVNNNAYPDYNENPVHVRYHDNADDLMDVVCPDHHVSGETVMLCTIETAKEGISGRQVKHGETPDPSAAVGKYPFTNGNNILIGWSMTKLPVVMTKDEYDAMKDTLVSSVTVNDTGAEVYAVWAPDKNGNGTPDYDEERSLRYDGNAQPGGTVENLPVDTKRYLPEEKAALSKTVPLYTSADGKAVVFCGWTAQKNEMIFSRENTAPEIVEEVNFTNGDATVYAAWGYDDNGDGTADVLEVYSFGYDLNGGQGTLPGGRTNVKKGESITLTQAKNFTRNPKEAFAGWSIKQFADVFTADQMEELKKNLITDSEIIMGTEDITLYAVWAEDKDGDNVPDFQTTYTVTYNLNGGLPATGVTYGPEEVKGGTVYTLKAEPYLRGYLFKGWKDEAGTVYQAGDKLVVNSNMKLTAQWGRPIGDIDPIQPDRPGGNERPNGGYARTGDQANMALWLSLSGVSVAGILAVLIVWKRRRKGKQDK